MWRAVHDFALHRNFGVDDVFGHTRRVHRYAKTWCGRQIYLAIGIRQEMEFVPVILYGYDTNAFHFE